MGWRLERFLEFARILVIASEQSDRSNLGILEFPRFLQPLSQSPKGSTNLEFLRINLEFLEIASAFSKPRNDENSRIPYRDPPKGLGDDIVREF